MSETGADLVQLLSVWLEGTGIGLLELRTANETVRLTRDAIADRSATLAPMARPGATVTSPSVGVFLHRHPLRQDALVQPGQAVVAGDVVGLLQVGALLLHVTAPADSTVAAEIAPDGSTVGYGAPLLRLEGSAMP